MELCESSASPTIGVTTASTHSIQMSEPEPDPELADAISNLDGDDVDGDPVDLPGAETADTDTADTTESLLDRLLNSEPNPPLETVENPWNPDEGGVSRVFRGIQKIGDITGLPAVADILIGLLEAHYSLSSPSNPKGDRGEDRGTEPDNDDTDTKTTEFEPFN